MVHEDYFAALQRLVDGKPTKVPKGTRITNDAVSIEAGRVKGSIKKARPQCAALIAEIDAAAAAQKQKQSTGDKLAAKYASVQEEAETYRVCYEAALAREEALVAEIMSLKQKLRAVDESNVIPIRTIKV